MKIIFQIIIKYTQLCEGENNKYFILFHRNFLEILRTETLTL